MTKSNLNIFLVLLLVSFGARAQSLTFNSSHVYVEQPPRATGLDYIYVIDGTQNVQASFASSAPQSVHWQRFSSLGGGFAEDITSEAIGGRSVINLGTDDMGYIVEDGHNRYYFWIVNYQNHELDLQALEPSQEQDCAMAFLDLKGNADAIKYYNILGHPHTLSRELELQYETLKYDASGNYYVQEPVSQTLEYASQTIRVNAPLCNTQFSLRGDRFLQEWGRPQHVQSPLYMTRTVEATTSLEQDTVYVDNMKKNDNPDALGGSAPVLIAFKAAVTDAAIFTEWQFSKHPDFEDIDLRFSTPDFDYTFTEAGTTYIRFMCADASGECEYISDTYTVFIGESALDCPNAFSPGASEGTNDIWKVSYRSLLDFECHIFNRYGREMCSFTDPSQGWDGKYGGKVVPAGVYYYVIKATGSDGKKYNLSGDINIVNYVRNKNASSSTDTTE